MEIVKNIRKNTVLILMITMLVLVLVLKEDFASTVDALKNMDYKYLVLAFLAYALSIILKGVISYKVVNEKDKYSLKESIKHNVIVQFFNGITPFSTGGQPMEVYMLKEHNIRISHATNFIMQNFIFYQIALVLFGLFAVLYNMKFHLFPDSPILRNLVLLGFIINSLVAVFLFIIAFSQKFTSFIIYHGINLFSKLKLIKDKEVTKERWKERIAEFHKSTKELKKRKLLAIEGILLNLLSLACFYIVPLFIVYSMHDFESITAVDSLVTSAYVLIIGSFVPIPGASGGIEYGFLSFFHAFLSSGVTSAVLLVWRFITYYLPMIIGAIVFNFDEGSKKYANRNL